MIFFISGQQSLPLHPFGPPCISTWVHSMNISGYTQICICNVKWDMSGVIFKANIIQAKSVLGFNMKFLFVLYIGEILVDKWYLTQAINPKNENIFLLKIAKYWCLLFDEINQSWTCCFLYLYYSIGWGYCLFNSSSSEKEVNEKSETPWYGSQLGDALHFKYGSEKNWQNQQKIFYIKFCPFYIKFHILHTFI